MADKKKIGRCYLVGAGPGDLGLVTLARPAIDRARGGDRLRLPLQSRDAGLGAGDGRDHLRWEKGGGAHFEAGGDQCAPGEKTGEGKQVVRLKGGDPFLFGRGGEEAQALAAAGLPYEVVPGVTSAIAAPAYAGIPVTHRGMTSHVTFFTGHEDPEKTESSIDFEALAKLGGTQVMLMGVERIEAIAQQMMEHGVRADLPVALIRWGTTGRQQSIRGTLSTIAQQVAEAGFARRRSRSSEKWPR